MTPRYTELQLDALRELANIASGNAATALSQMLGREVELSVPRVLALPLADAIEACGAPDESVTSVVIPLEGDVDGLVLLLISCEGARALCRLLGVEPGSEIGDSALREIGTDQRACGHAKHEGQGGIADGDDAVKAEDVRGESVQRHRVAVAAQGR